MGPQMNGYHEYVCEVFFRYVIDASCNMGCMYGNQFTKYWKEKTGQVFTLSKTSYNAIMKERIRGNLSIKKIHFDKKYIFRI